MASFPAKIGKYDVEGVIGHGGMGVVYKAVDSQIGRHVAIKMINSGGDASLIERFRSEARNTGSLHCPNIVTVYNVGEQDGNPYLVMQFLEGPSLESMLQQGISLTLAERLGIIIDVCNGLAYAHQRGVIHRDIKPANIIVLKDGMNDGMAVIVDFGIARIMGDTHLTRSDQLVGSVPYMSAEQLLAEDLDNRTDIYSTGVVLFQLLTGALPFDAKETPAILFKILNEPPPPLSALLNDYPPQLQDIITRVLAKKREERYSTAKDLAFDLFQLQERIKSEAVGQMLRRAEAAVAQQDWAQANDQLLQVLRIDRQNTSAQKMMSLVQERLRRQQELERVHSLRRQADEACKERRYDDALRLADQALTLDAQNPDLVAFRDSVRAAKERALVLRRALRRAESALEDGDLAEAESAVNDALQIDAQDTQAKVLKVIVAQRFEEHSRRQKLQGLLDQARGQISAGDLSGAFATLKAADEVDPSSVELQKVAAMAAAARQQERHRLETEELRRKIENALVQEDFIAAVALAEQGLRKFPQESTLLKLKGLAETQQTRVEQRKFVREQFATATSLAESGQVRQAISTLDRALQRVPANPELESLRFTLRKRVEEEESQQRKQQAINATVDEAKRLLQKQNPKSAREFLETRASQYSDSPQIQEIHQAVRIREELDALDRSLASEPNPARRLKLGEEAARSSSRNQDIQRRLADLQQERAQISSAIDHARGLEISERFSEAIKEWQKLKKSYPRVPEFEAEISRLEVLRRETKKAAKVAASLASPVHERSAGNFSATRVLTTESAPGSEATAEFEGLTAHSIAGGATPRTKIDALPRQSSVPALAARDWKQHFIGMIAGPGKYFALAGLVVIVVAVYSLSGHRKPQTKLPPHLIQVRITTTPPDAKVTLDSQPLANGTVPLIPGGSVTVEVARLGYKTKAVEIRPESDGNIVLEPEPLHLSIQTSEKTGVVQLDGNRIADLTDGNMDEYLLPVDGNSHQLSVTARGRQLFAVQIHAIPGSVPQVDTFDVNGMLLVTTLGNAAKLYAGSQLNNVQLGDQKIATSPSGADLTFDEPQNGLTFGNAKNQGSVPIVSSNAPRLAVYSPDMGGQVEITSNVPVANATLKVNGTVVKHGRHGWLVSKPPGDYTFELSADGYDPQSWPMTLQRGQVLPRKNVALSLRSLQPTAASLIIIGGTPEALVTVDGASVGRLDMNGNLQISNKLSEGSHSITLSKANYEGRTIPVTVKGLEFRLPGADAKLSPWPRLTFQTTIANVKIDYKRVDESQWHEVSANEKPILRPGQYEVKAQADGFEDFRDSAVTVAAGEDKVLPLTLASVKDYLFQDPKQISHAGEEWVRANEPHKWVYLKPGILHVNLIFMKPGKGKFLFLHKKVEWLIEDGGTAASVQYALDGQKLTRKLVAGKQQPDQKEIRVDAVADSSSLSVHIQVDGFHLTISNDKGVVLDDYTVPNNFSTDRLGIRSESEFVVRKLSRLNSP